MNRTMDDFEKDILALAIAVGDIVTIPDPKPRTVWERIDHVADIAYDKIVELEHKAAEAVVREMYVGRHRMVEKKKPSRLQPIWNRFANRTHKVLRPVLALGARIDRPLLTALERATRKSREEAAEMNRLRAQMARAQRDISFFHHVINLPREA